MLKHLHLVALAVVLMMANVLPAAAADHPADPTRGGAGGRIIALDRDPAAIEQRCPACWT